MKKICVLFFLFLISISVIKGQDWTGIMGDNYSGVLRTQIQPASIVSSPLAYDINLVGFKVSSFNGNAFDLLKDELSGNKLDFLSSEERAFMMIDLILPSMMYQINEKNAVSFSGRARTVYYSENSGGGIRELLKTGFENKSFEGLTYEGLSFNARANVWWELGFTYARQLLEKGNHQLNAGLTLKYVFGQASGYADIQGLSFGVGENQTLLDVTGKLDYAYNKEIDAMVSDGDFDLLANSSVSGSIGIEYLYRPDEGFYKFKLGLSLVDVGYLNYKKSDNSGIYSADKDEININALKALPSLANVGDSLQSIINEYTIKEGEKYEVGLPTKLIVQLDYRLTDKYYINGLVSFGIENSSVSVTKSLNTVVVTPRLEKEGWAIHLPFSYNEIGVFSTGISARVGPLYVGSSNLFRTILKGENLNGLSFFMGIKTGHVLANRINKRKSKN